MARDYAGEMRAVVDAETAGGAYTAPLVAARIVEKLRQTDPELLQGWLDLQAVGIVGQAIGQRDRSLRARARQTRGRGEFADAAARHGLGQPGVFARWLDTPWTVGQVRVRLRDMTVQDLQAAAGSYSTLAAANRRAALFLSAIARQVQHHGAGRVGEVMSDQDLQVLWGKVDTPDGP